MSKILKLTIISFGIILVLAPLTASAVPVGKVENFNIERVYDLYGRSETKAILQRITNQLYFYVDEHWWNDLEEKDKRQLDEKIYNLSVEFERKIYPELTSTFGKEAEFGVDGDPRITVLIHPMIKEAGGYFSSGDIYEKIVYPRSNQRKIIYLNALYIDSQEAPGFLAHEFVHLITINQKDLTRGVSEEIWLNEARSEYAPTLLGYDTPYQNSSLERRVRDFLSKPSVSLTEWLNKKEDYGVVNLFTQYLVDHYGVKILADSLQSDKAGIESINYVLKKNGFKEDFSQIFKDWVIAVLINDCNVNEKYCYLNEDLKNFRLDPAIYQLPKTEITLATYHQITHWQANWQRFTDGTGTLLLEFTASEQIEMEVPYLLCDLKNKCSLGFILFDQNKKGKIEVLEFSQKYGSLIIMPFAKGKTSGFNGQQNYFNFSWQVSSQKSLTPAEQDRLTKELLAQIESLKKLIAEYQARIRALTGEASAEIISVSCQRIDNDLYFGIKNSPEVSCLQQALKAEGSEIYPQGLITGNFLSLTQAAVIRFQEKYAQEILAPWELTKGTGYVGEKTRAKINQLINF